ncbi:hypothetical protein CLOP_g14758 [Closterium sp. NIES-67]|nr:hypothetical protein CLOP_g14758 [Closterium sp. NIES-67]
MAGMSLRSGTRLQGGDDSLRGEDKNLSVEGGQAPESPSAEREETREEPSPGEEKRARERRDSSGFAMRADRQAGGGFSATAREASAARAPGDAGRGVGGPTALSRSEGSGEVGAGNVTGAVQGTAGGVSHRSLWEEGTRYRYTSLPKVEVPARFTGDQQSGPRLKTYAMHVRSEKFCWEQDGLDLRHFFRSLGNTLAGDAEAFFLEVRDLLLQEEERDALGRVRRDAEGRALRLQDPTEKFLEELQVHFPTQTPAKLREFEQLRRAPRESLLAYYRRVDQLAEDISCNEPRIVVAKFLEGLSGDLARTARDHTYNLGPNATLRQAYEIAWRNEQSLSLYDLGRRSERSGGRERDRRGVSWSGAMLAGSEGEEERTESRGYKGKPQRSRTVTPPLSEEPVCYKCREPGHFKRDCPKLQTCSYCQRRGHSAENCYTKQREERGKGGRKGRIEALEEELRRLKAEEEESDEEDSSARLARSREGDTEEKGEPFFMASGGGRDKEELGLRSGGVDRRREVQQGRRGPRARVSPTPGRTGPAEAEARAPAGGRHGPHRHPFERMAAKPCVVEAMEGAVAVEGKYPGTTIIDTGASQVLVGRRLAERLGLHREENVTPEGVRIQTAEGGAGKWLPRTLRPQEVVLAPGAEDETRIRVHCLVSDSDDYDLLLGMELLYKIGAVVDTWTEKVTYQPRYWDHELSHEESLAVALPARFLRSPPGYRGPPMEKVPEQRFEDAGVYLERASERRKREEAAGHDWQSTGKQRGSPSPHTTSKPSTDP